MPRLAPALLRTGAAALVCVSLFSVRSFTVEVEPIDRLDAGVQAAEGVRAVKRLQLSYGYYLDAGLWSDLGDLFTANAVADIQGQTVSGRPPRELMP